VVEDYSNDWRHYEQQSDDDSYSVNDLPEAPTPPSAVERRNTNVFDFLIENPTPTASHVSLPTTASVETQLVRFDPDAEAVNGDFEMKDDSLLTYDGPMPPPSNFETPAPKTARRKVKDTDKEGKKDKKRKRLHIETDHAMQDAPPVLHSGLTGGLNRLMSRPSVFPPSPDYSGDNNAPPTPIKKSKSKKPSPKNPARSTTEALSSGLMAMIAGPKAKPAKKKAKTSSSSSPPKKKSVKRLDSAKEPKLLEYRPGSKEGETTTNGNEIVVFKPRVDHFLSFVNKGPESDRGCSLNKALKRYHRERSGSGVSLSKALEEKELFKSLRMKKNDRGEIVLFCV